MTSRPLPTWLNTTPTGRLQKWYMCSQTRGKSTIEASTAVIWRRPQNVIIVGEHPDGLRGVVGVPLRASQR